MRKSDSPKPDYSLETLCCEKGFSAIAGVDEAGRGPWAGPVVAAAVILNQDAIPKGLNDSKKLSEQRREELFDVISETSHVGIGIADEAKIDDLNILHASLAAMTDAVDNLPKPADFALIDGNKLAQLPCPGQTIVKGDSRSLSIAAASIIAKVTRDQMMRDLAKIYPGYGFERHKGYGTAQHQSALAKLGPCPHHRKSFAPIAALLAPTR
ncbi:MAG: ribonuclease HII [Hyphomicrobiales bacterium]